MPVAGAGVAERAVEAEVWAQPHLSLSWCRRMLCDSDPVCTCNTQVVQQGVLTEPYHLLQLMDQALPLPQTLCKYSVPDNPVTH